MFDGTTETLTETAESLEPVIQREHELLILLLHYEWLLEDPNTVPDLSVLRQAEELFQQRLAVQGIGYELAHLAVLLYYHLCAWETLSDLLLSYRQQCVLAPLEEAWAWWHSVDCLALQRKDHLMMEEQKRFFLFAQQHFFPEHCLFVCSDSTQARSWLMQQQEEEWLALCVSLLEKVKRNDETRYDRFLLLRSMVTILLRNASPDRFGRIEDVLITITDMLQENRGWPRHEELFLEATALQIQVLNMSDGANESHLRQLGVQASSRVDAMARHMSGMAQTRVIRRLAHNIGGDLFFAHQYDLAIPLLEQARALGSTSSYTALWLAASLRALKQREQQVQALLQEVAIFSHDVSLQQQMSSLPELQC